MAVVAGLTVASSVARADTMLGGAGAAYATPEGANVNPANAAWVDRTQVDWHPELFKSSVLNVRYPGYETVAKSDTGMGNLLAEPGFIYKVNPRFGIGGYALPPLPFEIDIEAKKIPVVVLGAQNFVDIIGKGSLGGMARVVAGYRLTDNFGAGLTFSFRAVNFEGELIPSEGGPALASIVLSTTDIAIGTGLRWDVVPGKFAVGTAVSLAKINNTDVKLDSPLLGAAGGGEEPAAAGPKATTTPLNSILVGLQYVVNPKVRLLLDVQYDRADTEATGQSFVDFKTKRKDVYDTVSPRVGAILAVINSGNLLVGGRYDPASTGPGSVGDEDPSVGYGTMDLIMIFMGQGALTPGWQVGGGVQMGFAPKLDSGGGAGKNKKPRKAFYQWTLGAGFTYRYASLGVDTDGELPGAYQQKSYGVPVSVTYRF